LFSRRSIYMYSILSVAYSLPGFKCHLMEDVPYYQFWCSSYCLLLLTSAPQYAPPTACYSLLPPLRTRLLDLIVIRFSTTSLRCLESRYTTVSWCYRHSCRLVWS
jgi:hypothetical protein